MNDDKFNFNPQSAMDVVRNANIVSWERSAEAQKNAPAASYAGSRGFLQTAVGCGMMFAILGFVWGILEDRDHTIAAALIGAAKGFALGAAIGAVLCAVGFVLGGAMQIVRSTRLIRFTIIGAIVGAIAAVALVYYLNDPGAIDRALMRLVPIGAGLGFVLALLRMIFSRSSRKTA